MRSQEHNELSPWSQATGGPPRRPVPELSWAPPLVYAVEPCAGLALRSKPSVSHIPVRPFFTR